MGQPRPLLRRRIATIPAALIIVVSLIAVAIPVLMLRARTDESPTVIIPHSQQIEFENKRRALEAADALYAEARYEEALRSYQAYLDVYPHSVAAEEGRDRAALALARSEQGTPEQKIAAARTKKKKEDEDISPRELLNKIKRLFQR